jgi:hypothetical protein
VGAYIYGRQIQIWNHRYVPGKEKVCEKIRDALNAEFKSEGFNEEYEWKCTPVCLNKFNKKSKCDGKRRRERRIRRLADNESPHRYDLSDGPNDLYIRKVNKFIGDEESVVGTSFKGLWDRKESRVVGLDYSKCECQKWGDSHLTYGYNVTKERFEDRRGSETRPYVAEPTFQMHSDFQGKLKVCNRKWSNGADRDGNPEVGRNTMRDSSYKGACVKDTDGDLSTEEPCFCDIPVGAANPKKQLNHGYGRAGSIKYTDLLFAFSCGHMNPGNLGSFRMPSQNYTQGGYPLWNKPNSKTGLPSSMKLNCLQQCFYAVDSLR